MEDELVNYLDEWELCAKQIPDIDAGARGRMLLAKPTLDGLRIIGRSLDSKS